MKRLLALVTLLASTLVFSSAPRVASAAVSIAHTNLCLRTTTTTSYACTITLPAAGNLLVAIGNAYTAAVGCVLSGTSFTAEVGAANQAGDRCSGALWMVVPGSPSTTVTFSAGVTAAVYELVVVECAGCNTVTPIDKSAVGNNGGNSSSTCVTSAVVPSQTGDLLLSTNGNTTANQTGAITSSPANTWTTTNAHDNTTGVWSETGTATSASTTSLTTTWTWGAPQVNNCSMVAVSPAGATPAGPSGAQKWTGAYILIPTKEASGD